MLIQFKAKLHSLIQESLAEAFPSPKDFPSIEIETPAEKIHGEFSTNIALKSAKILKQSPLQVAEEFVANIKEALASSELKDKIEKIEIKNPGFINFFLSREALYDTLSYILKEKQRFGTSTIGKGKKIQIEFVSANPTGPLSVAHARQAAVGDALGNILAFLSFAVTKEYYINDRGNQIKLLGESVRIRIEEILTKEDRSAQLGEGHYKGEYLKSVAKAYLDQFPVSSAKQLKSQDPQITQFTVDHILAIIRKELDDFGVRFDVWSSETKIATKDNIEAILDYLGEKGFLYEKDGALWFKSTDFGDDKDRVLEKSDGTHTYLTPDIVYHKKKLERGFSKIINIWGPDHHGYIPRLKAAVEALGYDREILEVLIVQLATIYRDGKPVSMSTRQGQFISLQEVMEEVGVDAARFFFLMRHIEAHLEFDLELAKKQTPENPVYYIQYAYARINSIYDKADIDGYKPKDKGFKLLKETEELDLIKKAGNFPQVLIVCYNQLDPYTLGSYLLELAICFHKFYDKHRVLEENRDLASERLALISAVKIIFENGLRLLGVSTPKKM